ncbi:TSN33 protein, partial [Ciccaba nigrolineata]|nr:TSN33 protein [Ciccaba nigrolineata]
QARGKVSDIINAAIVHYRDDPDLQNLIDFGQKEAVVNTQCGWGVQARGYLEAGAVIYTTGCVDTLGSWIHSNLLLLGGIALGLALPQLVGIMLAQILIHQIKDQIKLQLYNHQHRADPWY